MIKAIIFDVDGTLSETEELHRKAFNRAFGVHHLSWHWSRDEYKQLLEVTGGKERISFYMQDSEYARPAGEDLARFVRDLHHSKTEFYTQLVMDGAADLRPGIRELIRAATSRGIRLAIATTTSLPNVKALLHSAFGENGMGLFEVICAGDSVAVKKPAPDIYESALAQLGLQANECIAIEDSRNGLLSACAAGLATIVTPGIYTRDQCFDEAALIVADLGEDLDISALLRADSKPGTMAHAGVIQ